MTMADPGRLFVNTHTFKTLSSSTSLPSSTATSDYNVNNYTPTDHGGYTMHTNYNNPSYGCQEMLYRSANERFTCGACFKYFETICELHNHLGFHGSNGSYHYDSQSRMAFPKNEMVFASVQTEHAEEQKLHHDKTEENCRSIDSIVNVQTKTDKVHVLSRVGKENLSDKEVNVSLGAESEQVFNNITLWMQISAEQHTKIYGEPPPVSNDQNKNVVTLKKLTPGKVITTKNLLICVTQKPESFTDTGHNREGTIEKAGQLDTKGNPGNTTKLGVAVSSIKQEVIEDNVSVKVEVDDVPKSDHVRTYNLRQNVEEDEEEDLLQIKIEHFCYKCKIGYATDNYLQNHLERHEGKFPCDHCFNTFPGFAEWTNHICKRFEPRRLLNMQLYNCESCDQTFGETQGMKGHICEEDGRQVYRPFSNRSKSSMSPEDNFSYKARDISETEEIDTVSQQCNQCSDTLANQYRLYVHRLMHHEFPYKCAQCCVFFKNDEDKTKHEEQCQKGNMWQCYMCYRSFSTKFYLDKHQLLHKVLQCEKCGQAFSKRGSLRRHRASCPSYSERQKNHECEVCKKKFYDRRTLRSHRNRVHNNERSFICEVCGSTFKYSNALKKHAVRHLPERPSYKCEVCDATFNAVECLRRHKKRHSDNRFSEQCNICGKLFMERWNLKAHMRQHTGEKPYVCDICGQGFTHNVSRKTHMRNHHSLFI